MPNIIRIAGGGMNSTLLWTNPNPTSAYSGKINIDISDYDYLQIESIYSSGRPDIKGSGIIQVSDVMIQSPCGYYDTVRYWTRDGNAITPSIGHYSDGNTGTNCCIPQRIFGIKGKIN